ncbi:alpha/beta hydrolase [Nonomuraea sp. NPDC049714]|uniref:alpha/beta hydrolase family protein n=1 Tax=Nonomuraea sp. NPDC049714 TaxID=3364357 RepID=UPI0037B0C9A2
MSHAIGPLRVGPAVTAGLAVLVVTACSAPAPPRSVAVTSPSPAASTGAPALPAPTGALPVGTTALYLKDASRPDPWVPEAKARELMVTLWYPARTGAGRRAPYMTAKESELTLRGKRVTGAPYDMLSRTRTNASSDVEPAGRKGGLPLVVLSPGFTMPVSTLTSLAEDLASHGYVVAGIDHAHESYATTFPDGRIATCVACDSDTDPGFGTRVVQGRAADVSFALDRLTGSRPAWDGSGLIDRSRIAMAGQSIGGAGSVAAMLRDTRVRAGIDLDGTTYARIPKSGLSRPFLFVGSPEHVPGGRDNSWDRDWKLLTGWKRWLTVEGANHQSFTDVPVLAGSLGVPAPGGLSAARSAEITRAYVRAFLDLHLRDGSRRPWPRHPEVKVCTPGSGTCA